MPLSHADHVRLLRDGVTPGGVWADLGSGWGAFTLALAELLGPAGQIHSVDRDRGALERQAREMAARFPSVKVGYQRGDFTTSLDLAQLDGIVMANSLHFVRDKEPVVQLVGSYLKPGGRLILVEYDSDRGNLWVPHPLSFTTWQATAQAAGFSAPRLLAAVPSGVLGRIYSALSLRRSESSSG
jgi:ubiquinone/menaquinone biosynthesis C-methylase UbiE